MLETPHVAVAAAIAYKIPNPLISIPLALGSHFLLEMIPHWNPHLNTEMKKFGRVSVNSTKVVVIDVILSLVLGFFVAGKTLPDSGHFTTVIAASFFGVLPDIVEGPYYFFKIQNEFIEKVWIPFQKSLQNDTSALPGLSTQLATVLGALFVIFG